ncbi:MAG: PrsW family intramembrane metalloprotease [Clostridia bacterium]|nr:PrsW family intramembrane metalloprotease [Clostridia bacterium]
METNLLFLALLPGILIIVYIFRKDKVEHEPVSLIVRLLIFGAISCIPAIFAETFMGSLMPAGFGEGSVGYAVFNAFLVAALCEEVCKFLLLWLGSWRNRNYNYRFDGIVYGVCVAVGFALLENVMYVMQGGLYTALMRGVLAVPLHAFCGVYMGIHYGAAKRYSIEGQHSKAWGSIFLALFAPFLIHGIYDSLAFMGEYGTTFVLLAFVLAMYILAVKVINRYAREDWHAGFYLQQQATINVDDK